MPPTLDLPPAERLEALKAFIAAAPDKKAARQFVLELLDADQDAELLNYLAEDHPE